MTKDQATTLLQQIKQQLSNKLIGQPQVVEQVIIALLSNGHVLIEGIPGLGKTLLVRALAECFLFTMVWGVFPNLGADMIVRAAEAFTLLRP